MIKGAIMKLDVRTFAVTLGLSMGLGVMGFTLWSLLLTGPRSLTIFARIIPVFSISLQGSLIGFGWAFLSGFIGGFVFSSIYNFVVSFLK